MTISIHMDGVASYKTAATLETDKKLTLVYGLNGTGKSTLSNYLYSPTSPNFAKCNKTGLDDATIHVYNATFVRDNFYEKDNLKGIFTLSKANKEVEEKLAIAKEHLEKLNASQEAEQRKLDAGQLKHAEIRTRGEESVWPIKTQFTGGDRVLAYCLTGLQVKAKLFDHLLGSACPVEQPETTTDELKKNAEVLQDSSTVKLSPLQTATDFTLGEADKNLMVSSIVGNKNSVVAGLIEKLQHADWVSEGVHYMDALTQEGSEACPFCQQNTINSELAEEIKQYFDESFTTAVQNIKKLQNSYDTHWITLQSIRESAQQHFLISELQKDKLSRDLEALDSLIDLNKNLLAKKIEHPSQLVDLRDTKDTIHSINAVINAVNEATDEHNKKLDDRAAALSQIKTTFWNLCRWKYSREIAEYVVARDIIEKDSSLSKTALQEILREKNEIQATISVLQLQVVNVDHAVSEINRRLVHMGIDSFRIEKHGENSYRLSRYAEGAPTFQTLSEGEKTVISFLYFMELCKGQLDPSQILHRKVLVIDDPISSLSHLYVFNIGRAIRDELCSSPLFEKIIVLTHSLYFFYELTDTNHKRRNENQKLIRLVKGSDGARFEKMSYESIQNDYHSYWNVIRDQSGSPALIANCMRSVIEYFFGFVKKASLENVFAILTEPHHQAFYRYVNRESHSVGQNIYDFKEFDYEQFRECLRHVFSAHGFEEHYEAMMAK